MLIWANKKEINQAAMLPIAKMYKEKLNTDNLMEILKAWELSVILRQIKRHFGDNKDISILDFGTGTSPFPAYLNHIGYKRITCLDKVKGRHRDVDQKVYNERFNSSVIYKKTDIMQSDIGIYDVIFSASVLEHIGEERTEIMQTLAKSLTTDGLFIHVVDYEAGVNFKELIDNCGIPISCNPKITPGCKEFNGVPKYTWWTAHKKMRIITRVAFFNER